MRELMEFLQTTEAIIICAVALGAIFLCLIIYLVDKNKVRVRQRNNTRELNKIVEQVQTTLEKEKLPTPVIVPLMDDNIKVEQENTDVVFESFFDDLKDEKLEYTSIEPDEETAKEQLKQISKDLKKQDEQLENIELSNYEELQEENAIISMDELLKKGKELYQTNETTQYKDEDNLPITIQELEEQTGLNTTSYKDKFKIEELLDEEEVEEKEVKNGFRSSPFISPIYGVESKNKEMTLENTADYDKLDDEIKRTNEFLMTLKELQKKLD